MIPSVSFAALLDEYRQNRALRSFLGPAALIHHAKPSAPITPSSETTMVTRPLRASLSVLSKSEYGQVHALAKRPDSFFDHIGIGRASNVDVLLPLPEVSSYHAYVTHRADGTFWLADAGSLNGTRIGLHRLAPRKPELLANGARVYLGSHKFTFATAAGLYDLVCSRVDEG